MRTSGKDFVSLSKRAFAGVNLSFLPEELLGIKFALHPSNVL